MTPISEEQKDAVDRTLLRISKWIESRKLPEGGSCLVPDATGGFNLACDFLAHELRKIREFTDWNKENGYGAGYTLHVGDGER